MLQLRTLGTLELTAPDGRPLDAGLTQAKRAALLAYLVVALPRGWRTRDELVALFWPEMDDIRARAALRRALHFLRAALGPDVLRTRGDAVAVVEGALGCDVIDLERALADGRPEDAVALYEGEFLAGMYVREAPAFERWLDGERGRLRRRVADACWALAERARAVGDAVAVAGWTARVMALDPLDETALRRAIALLAVVGDVSGALRAYDAFASRLVREMDVPPSPETAALAAAIRAGGRAAAASAPVVDPDPPPAVDDVTASPAAAAVQAATDAPPPPPPPTTIGAGPAGASAATPAWTSAPEAGSATGPATESPATESPATESPATESPATTAAAREAGRSTGRPGRRRIRLSRAIPLAGALLASIYLLGIAAPSLDRGANAADDDADVPLRVLVLPFTVVGGSGTSVLADGMVELLSTALDGAGPLRIVDQRAVLPLASDERSDAVIRHAASRLGVRYLVQGSMVQLGSRLEARAVLLDSSGTTVASAGASGGEADLLGVADDLARQLLSAVNAGPEARLTRLAIRTSDSLTAVKAYLHGMGLLRAGAFGEAADSFRVAVRVDGDFALAYYNLSMALGWASGGRDHEATVMADRAVQHSGALGAHDRDLLLAHAESWGADPARAEQLYRQIVASYPDDVEAWHELGEVIFHSGPASGRSPLSARDAFQRVRHLPGLRAGVRVHLARLAALAGDSVALDSLADELPRSVAGSAAVATDARDDEVLLLHAALRQDGAALARWLADSRLRDDVTVWARAWSVARFAGDWRTAELIAQSLLAAGRPPEVQDLGWVAIAHFRIAAGRPDAAGRAVDRLAVRRPDMALAIRAQIAALSFVPSTAAERAVLRDSLDAAAARLAHRPRPADVAGEGGGALLGFPDDANLPASTSLLVAQLDWRDTLDARRGGAPSSPAAVPRRERLPASQPSASQSSASRLSAPLLAAAARLHRADSLAAAGRLRDALAWYASFPEPDGYDVIYAAAAALGEVRTAAAVGDSARAERARARLVALWRDAEPAVRILIDGTD